MATAMNCNEDISDYLYEPDRKNRKEIWKFIKLVAPTKEKKKWKSKDAVDAYCVKCKKVFNYKSGTSQQILRHLQKYHPDDLNGSSAKMKQMTIYQATKKLLPVNDSTAKKGHFLLLKWIAESYRPLSIVEESDLIDLVAFVNSLDKKYTMPSRHKMTRLLESLFKNTLVAIKKLLGDECDTYSLTSDIWTSRSSEAYISLMVHYITTDFDLKVVTLRCAPFSDVRHTGSEIANIVKESLLDAGMSLEKIVVYVTDNAANAIKSAQDLQVNHQGCVAHLLNLVIQKFTRWKIKDKNQSSLDGVPEHLQKITDSIAIVREYAKYLDNSTIGSQWFKDSMKKSNQIPKTIPRDIITRWNSTFLMLKVALKLRAHIDAFCSYIYTDEGSVSFPNCTKIIQISHEQWFLLTNVCKILEPFDLATETLSGEKYPTWSLTFPILREIKNNLISFKPTGGVSHAQWFANATETLEVFRSELLNEFKRRFQEINISLLWTIPLDPRLTLMNGFTTDERLMAQNVLLEEMKKVFSESEEIRKKSLQPIVLCDQEDNGDINDHGNHNYILGNIFSLASSEEEIKEEEYLHSVEIELKKYLTHCRQSYIRDPLKWWS